VLAVLSSCLLRLVSRFSKSAASTGAALLTTLLSSALVLFVRCSDLSTAATAAFSKPLLKPVARAALLLLPLLLLFVLPTAMLAATFSGLPLLLLVFLTVLAAAAMVLLYAPLPLPLIVRRMLRPLGVSMSTSKPVRGSMVAAASAVGGGKQGSIACRRKGLLSLHAQFKQRNRILE